MQNHQRVCDHLVGIIFALAFEAKHFTIAAVKFDNLFVRHTRFAMQTVDVLRD